MRTHRISNNVSDFIDASSLPSQFGGQASLQQYFVPKAPSEKSLLLTDKSITQKNLKQFSIYSEPNFLLSRKYKDEISNCSSDSSRFNKSNTSIAASFKQRNLHSSSNYKNKEPVQNHSSKSSHLPKATLTKSIDEADRFLRQALEFEKSIQNFDDSNRKSNPPKLLNENLKSQSNSNGSAKIFDVNDHSEQPFGELQKNKRAMTTQNINILSITKRFKTEEKVVPDQPFSPTIALSAVPPLKPSAQRKF